MAEVTVIVRPSQQGASEEEVNPGSEELSIITQGRKGSVVIPTEALACQGSVSTCSTSSGGPICRICQESGTLRRRLISPCYCSGSMGFFHASCLEKWLGQSGTNTCEVCKFQFQTVRVNRTFSEWLHSPRSERDRRYMWADSTCFLLLTPLGSISSWLCVNAAWQYHEDGEEWTALGLIMLTTFLSLMYLMWAVITFRYHLRSFRKWQQRNQVVKIVFKSRNENQRTGTMEQQNRNGDSSSSVSKPAESVVL